MDGALELNLTLSLQLIQVSPAARSRLGTKFQLLQAKGSATETQAAQLREALKARSPIEFEGLYGKLQKSAKRNAEVRLASTILSNPGLSQQLPTDLDLSQTQEDWTLVRMKAQKGVDHMIQKLQGVLQQARQLDARFPPIQFEEALKNYVSQKSRITKDLAQAQTDLEVIRTKAQTIKAQLSQALGEKGGLVSGMTGREPKAQCVQALKARSPSWVFGQADLIIRDPGGFAVSLQHNAGYLILPKTGKTQSFPVYNVLPPTFWQSAWQAIIERGADQLGSEVNSGEDLIYINYRTERRWLRLFYLNHSYFLEMTAILGRAPPSLEVICRPSSLQLGFRLTEPPLEIWFDQPVFEYPSLNYTLFSLDTQEFREERLEALTQGLRESLRRESPKGPPNLGQVMSAILAGVAPWRHSSPDC